MENCFMRINKEQRHANERRHAVDFVGLNF